LAEQAVCEGVVAESVVSIWETNGWFYQSNISEGDGDGSRDMVKHGANKMKRETIKMIALMIGVIIITVLIGYPILDFLRITLE